MKWLKWAKCLFLLWCTGPFWSHLAQMVKETPLRQSSSLKEQLECYAHFHPSWFMRKFCQQYYRSLTQGVSLKDLLNKNPFVPIDLQVQHLGELFEIMIKLGQAHPVEYPWGGLIRILFVIIWPKIFPLELFEQSTHYVYMLALISLCIVLEQSFVLWWKWRSIALTQWVKAPAQYCTWEKSLPTPNKLLISQSLDLWKKCYQGNHDLNQAALLFKFYEEQFYELRLSRNRRLLKTMLDIMYMFLLIDFVTNTLSKWYTSNPF